MITNLTVKIKSLSQKSYDDFLNHLQYHNLTCSCGISGHFTKHAYYTRTVKTSDGPIVLRILRVICRCCGKTHALFPVCIVPYSQILLNDHLDILICHNKKAAYESIMMSNIYIDESNIRYVVKQFLRHWKERITAFGISLDAHQISCDCLRTFKRQFMQIKCVPNILSA